MTTNIRVERKRLLNDERMKIVRDRNYRYVVLVHANVGISRKPAVKTTERLTAAGRQTDGGSPASQSSNDGQNVSDSTAREARIARTTSSEKPTWVRIASSQRASRSGGVNSYSVGAKVKSSGWLAAFGHL